MQQAGWAALMDTVEGDDAHRQLTPRHSSLKLVYPFSKFTRADLVICRR
jgi:hypothetical protein